MHVRPTTHRRRAGRYIAAALVSFSLVAAACGDKKDDEAVESDDTEPEVEETTPPDDGATEDTADVTTPESDTTEAPAPVVTEPPESEFDPVIGGRLVVAGEAEAANPWTPANVQCDSYCQMRVRAFYDPLFTVNDELEVAPYLAESITANEDSTAFTIKVREGITFHDGTPLDADAVMDNINRSFRSLLIGAAVKDVARNLADPGPDPDNPQILFEKVDDFTFTLFTGFNGDPEQPIPWPTFPIYLNGQAGLIASPTWLAAVDAGTAQPTDAVGTGPFLFQSYAPGDRLIVTKNPDYWRTDENGNQLPYLDEIEFRVIVDSQVRAQALESGDVDMIATSDNNVIVDYVDNPDFPMVLQAQFAETNYWLLHLTIPPLDNRDVRCALQQAIDKVDYIDVANSGYGEPANAPFSPGQEGYLADNGGPEYDPEAATAAIDAYEAANGPITINYSTTPTASNLTRAQFIADAWGAIGVDISINQIEQSTLINNALFGDPLFGAFGWRNHAGFFVDQQYFWWHSSAATDDGGLALNFGRLKDPELDALLEAARSEADVDVRRGIAEDINRRFADQCYIIVSDFTQWGVIHDPAVQNIGRTPLPDGDGFARDGAGFPGQVWLTAVFLAE
ncbi:MAG TPA: ABC transporter substrate-binding protein [Ilumatobacteraceae bacterium]|nr:ABC transporter substrate-binding protein [Ilumatobacteraceae bacterium]